MHNDLYAVVGNPISHSKSPRIHSLFARQTGEPVEYTAIQLSAGNFEARIKGEFEHGWKGFNVTVPFKEAAWKIADSRTERAERAGAANTLYLSKNGRLMADNTDGVGLVTDIQDNLGFRVKGKRILILGAGGAVRGVLGPLLDECPAELTIANRTLIKAETLVESFKDYAGTTRLNACGFEQASGPFDIIINGTSASLQGDLPPVPPSIIGTGTLVYDMMYSLTTTTFNQWAIDQGAKHVRDGLGMLVEQAAESFFVWRGVRPQTAPVIDTLRNE
jgi:shikimate dehydrogenase